MGMFKKQSLPTCRHSNNRMSSPATLWLKCNLNKSLSEHGA